MTLPIYNRVCSGKGRLKAISPKTRITMNGGFTQNPVTAYEPAYGQRESSHMLRWPYPAEFSRFERLTAYLKLL